MNLRSISATSYNLYNTCPYQWKLKYSFKCLQAENPAFIVGTAFHKGAELFHTGRMLEDIIQIVKDEMLSGKKTTPEELERFGLVRQMIEAYARNPIDLPTIKVEFKFNIPIFGLTAPLYGFVDRVVEGGLVEYKTSAKDYTIDDIDNIQTDIYSYAYRHHYKAMPLVTYCIVNKKKSKRPDYKPQVLTIQREDTDMDMLLSKLRKFEDSVVNNNFDPTPGFYCRWCSYSESCKYKKYG